MDPLLAGSAGPPYSYVRNRPTVFLDPWGLREVRFDGCSVCFYEDDGKLARCCAAPSGLPGTTSAHQAAPYEGPIPEGRHYIRPWEFSGGVRSLVRAPGWGWWRVPLHPAPKTPTFGRDGFFFHGDRRKRPGTAGCVDVGDCDSWAHDWFLEDSNVSVAFIVKYGVPLCNERVPLLSDG